MAEYATVEDYELRTGVDVPADQEDTIKQRLDDVSALVELYMGDCADEVAAAHPDILSALVCANVYRVSSVPVGVKSESVGATSVTYDSDGTSMILGPTDTDLLDALIARTCDTAVVAPGVGQYGITLGGEPEPTAWPMDIDFWVMSGGYRKW